MLSMYYAPGTVLGIFDSVSLLKFFKVGIITHF